jgi:hypothetical protein
MAELHGWPASVSFDGPDGRVTLTNGPAVAGARHPALRARGNPLRARGNHYGAG